MESYLHTIIFGLLIGILISAPMGPIGMLVIHRTLTKGRRQGLHTGLGAALSDFVYSLLTALGLAFVTDFISDNSTILQMVGSVVLVVYAAFLFKDNPSRTLKAPQSEHLHPGGNAQWRDFATGFLFTFSNPLILFFIIGLFARFNFLDDAPPLSHYFLGMLSLVVGAIAWWLLVSYSIDKVRHKFTLRSLKLINRVIGLILMVMGTFGVAGSVIDLLYG